ncbi:hypothetical protein ACJ41O_013995 [Fusarium nematophilum]
MIRGHGRGAGSFGSRSSLSRMPPIDENEVAVTPTFPSPPRMPLRVPKKSPRRAVNQAGANGRANGNGRAAQPKQNGGLPPPYVPPYILAAGGGSYSYQTVPAPAPTSRPPPPSYKEAHAGKGKVVGREAADEERGGKGRASGVARRRGCCLLGVAVVTMVVIAIGLGVGLTIGLKDRDDSSSQDPSTASASAAASSSFPAGSFAFKAALRETSTECTSNPSTWRCYPYTEGASVTFFWIITYVNTQYYTVSSTDNPFAPSFSNLTLSLLDEDTSQERLRFAFSMDKVVVPDDKLSSSNRAARCTFEDTRFEATMWTRKSGGGGGEETDGGRFAPWPGDVEIVQRKMGESGSPTCADSDGDKVADIKPGSGTCECRYSSFDDS